MTRIWMAVGLVMVAMVAAEAAEGPNKSVGEFLKNSTDVQVAYSKGVLDTLAITDYLGKTQVGDATCGRFRSYGELVGSAVSGMYRALGQDPAAREHHAAVYVIAAMKECR